MRDGLKPHVRPTAVGVPLIEEGGIVAVLLREVLPDGVNTGYEISFTRYFYKQQPLRTLEEIRTDILALERGTDGVLGRDNRAP